MRILEFEYNKEDYNPLIEYQNIITYLKDNDVINYIVYGYDNDMMIIKSNTVNNIFLCNSIACDINLKKYFNDENMKQYIEFSDLKYVKEFKFINKIKIVEKL